MVRAEETACRAQQDATDGVDRPIALLHIQNVNARIADMKSQTLLYGRSRRRARGFSLLEVLISIIILSFGLLGAVGLQATALKTTAMPVRIGCGWLGARAGRNDARKCRSGGENIWKSISRGMVWHEYGAEQSFRLFEYRKNLRDDHGCGECRNE